MKATLRCLGRLSLCIIAGMQVLSTPSAAAAPDAESVEYPLKLAFLYKFATYVEWPAASFKSSGAPLTICIVGKDPFSREIEEELRTRTVDGHPVEVKALEPGDALRTCRMVFIPLTASGEADRIVEGLRGSSTLTVGEARGFAALGGIINFTVEEHKLHFEINPEAAERAGLKISSKLLSIATIVGQR